MARVPITPRWVAGLFYPGGLLLLGAWAVQHEEAARVAAAPFALVFCFGTLGAAVLLSWYFDYGRVFFIAVPVGLTSWLLAQPEPALEPAKHAAVFLLAVNFGLFAWLKEQGVVTVNGGLRLGFLAAQVLCVAALARGMAGWLGDFLRWGARPAGWTWMAPAGQIAFAAAALVVLFLIFQRRTKAEQDLVWVLMAAFAGLRHQGAPETLLIYSGAAGLILLFGVMERGYHIAYRDGLTGLPGRRALDEMLPRLGSRYAIAMCDVDRFKAFNDTYGHDAGDQVLRMVATRLSRVRGGGRAFRYGGEEFAVVFRDRNATAAQPYVEALREAIAAVPFGLRKPKPAGKKPGEKADAVQAPPVVVTITISIGLAERSTLHSTPELVLDAADQALYLAKQSGRNCVKVAGSAAH